MFAITCSVLELLHIFCVFLLCNKLSILGSIQVRLQLLISDELITTSMLWSRTLSSNYEQYLSLCVAYCLV